MYIARHVILIIFFFLVIFNLTAQGLSGVWMGELTQNDKSYSFRFFVQLVQKDGHLTGASRTTGIKGEFVEYNIEGEVNGEVFTIHETTVRNYGNSSDGTIWRWCVKVLTGRIKKENGLIILNGDWQNDGSKNFSEGHFYSGNYCYPGTFTLYRLEKQDSILTKKTKDDSTGIQPITRLEGRRVTIIDSMVIEQPDVTVSLYDNGEIDGDTVSVYLNNHLIAGRRGLSDKAIELHLKLKPNSENLLTMYANNLGTIPPNTAVMIVRAGRLQKEVFISSDNSKSGAIKFILNP